MFLYTVVKNDYECPEELFHTCDEAKAINFVQQYNSLNDPDDNITKFVSIRKLDMNTIEQQANAIINKYQKKLVTTIYYNKLGTLYSVVSSKYQFIDIDNIHDSAEICDYVMDFNQWNTAYVYLITDTFPDINNIEIQQHIDKLLDEEYKFQYSLYND